MSENRRQVLEMLSSGRINPEEADRLLTALETDKVPPTSFASSATAKATAKYLRVVVDAADRSGGEAPTKVNVRIPMQLLRAGVRLAGLIPAKALDKANSALREQGFPIDLSQVKPENLEDLVEHLHDLSVNVDNKEHDGNVNVRVFCE